MKLPAAGSELLCLESICGTPEGWAGFGPPRGSSGGGPAGHAALAGAGRRAHPGLTSRSLPDPTLRIQGGKHPLLALLSPLDPKHSNPSVCASRWAGALGGGGAAVRPVCSQPLSGPAAMTFSSPVRR